MANKREPFSWPGNRGRNFYIVTRLLISLALLGGLYLFMTFNQRCYEVLHGLSHKECHPSNMSPNALEAIVKQTLEGAFAGRCERPLQECVLHVDVTVARAGEKCVSTVAPNKAAEWFNIQEMVYCDEK
ncbi:MAG TPA: hypothetical protein VGL10_03295 [Gammaproteobacteria bacterium]